MDLSTRGALRLFRAAGIDVYLHWSWFLIAGPLVNLLLIFPLWGLLVLSQSQDWAGTMRDLDLFLRIMAFVNIALLVLNLVPVYPLDGGQILHALLWFLLGRWNSLRV